MITPKPSFTWEAARERHAEIDAAVKQLLSDNPRIRNREIATQLGISYMDAQRSTMRLGITRPTDLHRKDLHGKQAN